MAARGHLDGPRCFYFQDDIADPVGGSVPHYDHARESLRTLMWGGALDGSPQGTQVWCRESVDINFSFSSPP